jgi:hypothetical protein
MMLSSETITTLLDSRAMIMSGDAEDEISELSDHEWAWIDLWLQRRRGIPDVKGEERWWDNESQL